MVPQEATAPPQLSRPSSHIEAAHWAQTPSLVPRRPSKEATAPPQLSRPPTLISATDMSRVRSSVRLVPRSPPHTHTLISATDMSRVRLSVRSTSKISAQYRLASCNGGEGEGGRGRLRKEALEIVRGEGDSEPSHANKQPRTVGCRQQA